MWNTAVSNPFLLLLWLKKHGKIGWKNAFKMNKGDQRDSNVQSAHDKVEGGKLGLRATRSMKTPKL